MNKDERAYREALDEIDMTLIENMATRMRIRNTMPRHIVEQLQDAVNEYSDWFDKHE